MRNKKQEIVTKKGSEISLSPEVDALLADLRQMIDEARSAVAVTVNISLTVLYWRVGTRINTEILKGTRAEYGKQILATLSQTLSWSHFRELLSLDRSLQREFYAEMCRVEGWSVRVLRKKLMECSMSVRHCPKNRMS